LRGSGRASQAHVCLASRLGGSTSLARHSPRMCTLVRYACEAAKAWQGSLRMSRACVPAARPWRTRACAQARATHGAWHGAWYFEVRVAHLGATGHCRLGWSTRKGELQGPVGYDMFRRAACRMCYCKSVHGDRHACVLPRFGSSGCGPPGVRCAPARSYGYRDVDGSKVHCALRESYGAAWAEVGHAGRPRSILFPKSSRRVLRPLLRLVGGCSAAHRPHTITRQHVLGCSAAAWQAWVTASELLHVAAKADVPWHLCKCACAASKSLHAFFMRRRGM